MKKYSTRIIMVLLMIGNMMGTLVLPTWAQVTWPDEQLLPSFPAPAPTQDLFFLREQGSETRWQAHTKIDWVGVQQRNDAAEMYLFASLKGIVNLQQPRLFSYEGDAFAEGPYTWLRSLGLDWTETDDKWSLIAKYRSELAGLIVYDLDQLHTVNLATMMAGERKALIASPGLVARLSAAPYNLPVLEDLRGRFTSKLQLYQTIYDDYWPQRDQRVLIGLSPERHKAALREYATALGATTVWLNPEVPGESELLNRFLSSMSAGSRYLGWWPEESKGITRASEFGIATIPSDYCTNLTVHSGMPREVTIKPAPL